jgi:hypothetical protein
MYLLQIIVYRKYVKVAAHGPQVYFGSRQNSTRCSNNNFLGFYTALLSPTWNKVSQSPRRWKQHILPKCQNKQLSSMVYTHTQSGTSIYRSRNHRFPACTGRHFWSRMKFHINNVIYSRIHHSQTIVLMHWSFVNHDPDAAFPTWIVWKKKTEAKYLLFVLPSIWTINMVTQLMQSRFARSPQLHVRIISDIFELYFVASGSVLSHVIYFLWTMAQPTKQVRT